MDTPSITCSNSTGQSSQQKPHSIHQPSCSPTKEDQLYIAQTNQNSSSKKRCEKYLNQKPIHPYQSSISQDTPLLDCEQKQKRYPALKKLVKTAKAELHYIIYPFDTQLITDGFHHADFSYLLLSLLSTWDGLDLKTNPSVIKMKQAIAEKRRRKEKIQLLGWKEVSPQITDYHRKFYE